MNLHRSTASDKFVFVRKSFLFIFPWLNIVVVMSVNFMYFYSI